VHVRDGKATVYSRRGYDWTETFASIARAAETLPGCHAVLDGEAIVMELAVAVNAAHMTMSNALTPSGSPRSICKSSLLFPLSTVVDSHAPQRRSRQFPPAAISEDSKENSVTSAAKAKALTGDASLLEHLPPA
jgi:hypothetical protein